MKISVILFFTILMLDQVLADPAIKTEKPKIAILNFKTYNCPTTLGSALADILAGKLFQTKQFTILERNQINLLSSKNNIQEIDQNDITAIANLGGLLKADKILIGSISKLDTYVLTIRIVNVETKNVEFSLTREAASIGDLKEEITPVNTKIDNYFKGYKAISGDYDIYIAPAFVYPADKLRKATNAGFGVNMSLTSHRPFDWKTDIMISTGIYYMHPAKKSIESLLMVPVIISIPYTISLTPSTSFIPAIGLGYQLSWSSFDEVDERASGEYQYKSDFFYNPSLKISGEFNFQIEPGYRFTITPWYLCFIESQSINMMPGIDIGIRLLF